jgi:hypothetical protein
LSPDCSRNPPQHYDLIEHVERRVLASACTRAAPETRKKENVMKRLRSVVKRSPLHMSNQQRRRMFLLATAFVTRGMDPDEAYRHAVYYTHGPGRGRTWISALTAHDPPNGVSMSHSLESTPVTIASSPRERSAVRWRDIRAYGAGNLFAALRVE